MTEEQKKLNLDDEFSFEIKPTKSVIAAVGAGVLVVIAGFLAYNIFAKPTTPVTLTPEQIASVETAPEENAVKTPETTPEKVTESKSEEVKPTPDTAPTPVAKSETVTSTWVAAAHEANSISGNEYVVKSGDTLWEIANGRYGSGFEWKKIADANNVEYNSVGRPLIYPGQVLQLP